MEKTRLLILKYEDKSLFNIAIVELDGSKFNSLEDVDNYLDSYWDDYVGDTESILTYSEKFNGWIDIMNQKYTGRIKSEYEIWLKKIEAIGNKSDDFDTIVQMCTDLKNGVVQSASEINATKKFSKYTSELIIDNGAKMAAAYRSSCPEKGCALLMIMDEIKPNVPQGTQMRFVSRTYTPDIFKMLPLHVQLSIEDCESDRFYAVFMDTKKMLVSGYFVSLNNGKVIYN